jgi:hypothetical protein
MVSNDTTDMRGGLIEIAALTTLIGATTAQSLILGSRGAAGLPWAVMSIFGSIFVAKACVAASTLPRLRNTLGVRNGHSDAALGLSLGLERTTKGAVDFAGAVGVLVRLVKVWLYKARGRAEDALAKLK